MQFLVLAMLVSVTLCDFLIEVLHAPAFIKFIPDALSVASAAAVVVMGMVQRFRSVRAPYMILFCALALIVICGLILNAVAPGPLVSGVRLYLRAIPFFFLPAIHQFSDRQIRRQLQVLLAIALLQLPLAIFQRFTVFSEGRFSGDDVFGTLMISSVLSMFLICIACVLTGMRMQDRLGKIAYLVTFFVLLIPTSINETKGTLVLLPLALFTTLMVGAKPEQRLSVAIGAAALIIGFFSIFIPTYNFYNTEHNPYGFTLSEFFSDENRMQRYLSKDSDVGDRDDPGRIDAIVVPLNYLARDPSKLLFGLGIGNASRSTMGPQFSGQYQTLLGPYAKATSGGAFLLEIGVGGTLLVLGLYWLIFSDARIVARNDPGLGGAIAIGWTGITVLITFATFYKAIHAFESMSYLFWYFSGLVAAQRMWLAHAQEETDKSIASLGVPPVTGAPALTRR